MSRDKGDIKEDLMSADNKESDGKKKKRIIIAIVSALLIALLSVGFLIYRDQFMAITMRIQRLVGTVNLYNEGHEQELREKMRLGAGQTVETAGESLIMVSLDDTKLMTMEESSKADIKARGKKLEFDLIEGNLFFNVTEKLKKRESFDIHTSTMICGIRGTSAYVGRDSTSHETLMVTDGVVSVDATNPVTKETIHVDVYAGEKITIFLDEEAEGDATISIKKEKFREEDLPSLALDAIRKSPELQKRIAKATGFSTERLVALADATSKSGVSMYGSAAEKLSADGIRDAIPIMGFNAQIMVRTANRAVDTAGEDLPLEIAIIKGLNGTMDSGIEAGYKGEPLGVFVDSAADCLEACIKGGRSAGLGNDDLVTVTDSVSGALQTSVGEMAKANLSTSEITQVVNAIGTVYTEAIATGVSAGTSGTDTDNAASAVSSGADASGNRIGNILDAIGNASEFVKTTVDSEMLKKSTGEETAAELLRKARTNETAAEEGQVKAAKPRQVQGNSDPVINAQGEGKTASSSTSSVNTQTASSESGQSAGTTSTAASNATSSSSSSSNSSSGSGSSGSNSNGNSNGGNQSSPAAVYGDMTIAGGISGGTVTTPLAAGSAPSQGETVTLNIAPNTGHSLTSLTVNTVDDNGNVTGSVNTTEVTPGSQYTFVMPAEKTVVNASFNPNTYNVNLNLNGATVTGGNITQYTYGTAVALPTQVTKASTAEFDYSFTGWTDAPTGGNPVTGITATDINDKNFYPQFSQTRRSYAVTKNTNVLNGSISVKVGTAEVTQAENSGTVTVTVTPNTGYELASLTYTPTGGNATAITATNGVYSFVMPTEDITVNATFTQIAYNLTATFDSTKGNVRFKVGGNYVTTAHYADVVVIELTPNTGYAETRPTANNDTVFVTYDNTISTYRFDMPAGDVNVAETFNNASYTVSLNAHGGTINAGNVTSYIYGTGATLPTNVTKASTATTDYAFAGWFTAETGGTQVTAISTTDTGNKVYHAQWTESARVYGISKGTVTNGTLTVKVGTSEVTQAANGATVTVTATPATGYELDTLTYTPAGGSATTITATNGVYSFTMPTSDVTINATFASSSAGYTLNIYGLYVSPPSTGGGGIPMPTSIDNPSAYIHLYDSSNAPITDGSSVSSGTQVRISFDMTAFVAANPGTYQIDTVEVKYGSSYTSVPTTAAGGDYTFTMPSGDTYVYIGLVGTAVTRNPIKVNFDGPVMGSSVEGIDVSFKINGVTQTSSSISAASGDTVQIILTYDHNQFTVSGMGATAGGYYNGKTGYVPSYTVSISSGTFTMPNDAPTITITYTGTGYPVFVGSALCGTATAHPTASQYASNVSVGDTVTITSTPDTGFVMSSVTVVDEDGDPISTTAVSNGFSFTMPSKRVTVTPNFTLTGTGVNITKALPTDMSMSERLDAISYLLGLDGLSKLTLTTPGGSQNYTIEIDSSNQSLSIPAGKTLELGSGVEIFKDSYGTFANNGTLIIGSGAGFDNGDKIVNAGTIVNNGTFNNYLSSTARITNTGTFTNNGTYSGSSGSTQGIFVNTGTLNGTNASDITTVAATTAIAGDSSTDGWTLNYGGELTITNPSGMNAWKTWISSNEGRSHRDDVLEVTISSGVAIIPSESFQYCDKLTTVTIPNSVTQILEKAFLGCSSLVSVDLPDNLEMIDDKAFYACNALTSISIPEGVSYLGKNAFEYCESLTTANIPSNVSSIKEGVFDGCVALSNLAIPEGVTSIEGRAFNSCESLTSITLPDSLTSIGYSAFRGCDGLTTINIPKNVTSIANGFCSTAENLSEITVDTDNTSYCSLDGVLLTKNQKTLVAYPGGKTSTTYSAPTTVETINRYAFEGVDNLQKLTVPSSVTDIQDYAFDGCKALERIDIYGNVTTLKTRTFCIRTLEVITIPRTVTTIQSTTFWGSALTDVYYNGSEEEWNQISIGNSNNELLTATKHFAVSATGQGGNELTASDIQSQLDSSSSVIVRSDVTIDSQLTITDGKTLTIASGKNVTFGNGATIVLASGGVLNNYGHIDNYSSNVTISGLFNNYSSNTLNNYGIITIQENGVFMNGDGENRDGRLNNFEGAVIENNGTIVNNEGSVVNNEGEIRGNAIVGCGDVDDDILPGSPSDWFIDRDEVRLTSDVDTDEEIVVGEGKTLVIESDVTLNARGGITIEEGGTVINYGTLNTHDNMSNNGTFTNYSEENNSNGDDGSAGPDPDEDGMPQSDPAVLTEPASESTGSSPDDGQNDEESSEEESESEEESSEEDE